MRKYVLGILLIVLAIICFFIIGFGVKIGNFKIYSYSDVSKASSERKSLLTSLNEKNITEYEETKRLLSSATQKYQSKKTEYDSLIESGKLTAESNIYNSNLYDVDYLSVIIGKYATQNGVTLQFDVLKSSSTTSISSEYVICNLNFTVTGDYIPITNFIYNLEDDETLNFEISDFMLEKGGENLQSIFVVKNVPINSKNLSAIPVSSNASVETNN
jgi:hypothetical protein